MKKHLLALLLSLSAFSAKSQTVTLVNRTCEPIRFVVYASVSGSNNMLDRSFAITVPSPYTNPTGNGITLDMYPGGSNPVVSWQNGGPPPGCSFTMVAAVIPSVNTSTYTMILGVPGSNAPNPPYPNPSTLLNTGQCKNYEFIYAADPSGSIADVHLHSW